MASASHRDVVDRDGRSPFVQIAAANDGNGRVQLYALDVAGHVWRYEARVEGWKRVPMGRE